MENYFNCSRPKQEITHVTGRQHVEAELASGYIAVLFCVLHKNAAVSDVGNRSVVSEELNQILDMKAQQKRKSFSFFRMPDGREVCDAFCSYFEVRVLIFGRTSTRPEAMGYQQQDSYLHKVCQRSRSESKACYLYD